jgi:hypothetical protein
MSLFSFSQSFGSCFLDFLPRRVKNYRHIFSSAQLAFSFGHSFCSDQMMKRFQNSQGIVWTESDLK